ncbi:MAG: UbiA family prenyltransferase [Sphingopyxis sp.]
MTDAPSLPPLVVDLDGTLTLADVTLESFARFVRSGPFNILLLGWWLLRGRAFAKAMVARRSPIDPAIVPLRAEVLALINAARATGRPVILASGSHHRNVQRIARHVGLFDTAIGTTASVNLKGRAKLARLRAMTGDGGFDYVGDCRADIPIWAASRHAYSTRLCPDARVQLLAPAPPSLARAILKSLRPHQWAKNALLFVPLATGGLLFDVPAFLAALLAALLFSAVASAIYQINDCLDIDADRAHASKRNRPLAAGIISLPVAMGVASALLLGAFTAAALILPPLFSLVLGVYLALTLAYSLRLKAVMTLDVIALGCLYTLRIIAGAAAIGVAVSFWLLAFSLFFFLSLGYLKRYTELAFASDPDKLLDGRGYVGSDLEVVLSAGMSAGMVSVLVMGLYVEDIRANGLYAAPDLLWGLALALLYWINRIWMMARRGEVDGDPVAFAIRDPRSIAVGIVVALLYVVARYWPW